jgi:hypothetical protein
MIKKFKDFLKEELSGTELVGQIGPAYGDTRTQNKTINSHDTNTIFCDLNNKIYTEDDYNNLYNDYLIKSNKKSIKKEFSLENINSILSEIVY